MAAHDHKLCLKHARPPRTSTLIENSENRGCIGLIMIDCNPELLNHSCATYFAQKRTEPAGFEPWISSARLEKGHDC